MGKAVRSRLFAVVAVSITVMSVLLTGCLQSDVDVIIYSDRSGQVTVEVFPNSDVQAALRGVDVGGIVDGQFEQVEGAEFEEFKRGDREGYRLIVPFDDYREVTDVITSGGTVAGQQVTLFSSFNITELADGGWELAANVNPIGQMLVRQGDFEMPTTLAEVMDAAGVGAGGTGLDLTIALPGKVVSSNADNVEGGSATWHLDNPDAPTELTMSTEPSTPFSPVVLIIGAAALVVILGLVLSLFTGGGKYRKYERDRRRQRGRRHRRKQERAPAPAPWAPKPGLDGSAASRRPTALPQLQPLEPVQPAHPAQPEHPAHPAHSEHSVEPEQPAQPVQPVQPERPPTDPPEAGGD